MKKSDLIIIFFLSLVVITGVAFLEPVPGYMDADYYYAGGVNLVSGRGFFDLFLWNYLDDPISLPHPSHTHWMPLPSIIAYLSMVTLGRNDFQTARLFFLIAASLISPITAWLSYRLTARRINGWIAGGLAIFSGYYLVFIGLVETFALMMLGGTVFLILMQANLRGWLKYPLLGLLAGCLHMTRADGILWLFFGVIYLFTESLREKRQMKCAIILFGAFITGYLCVSGMWYYRNFTAFGSLFPPGNSRMMWATEYDQIFSYPPEILTLETWWGAGIGSLLLARWNAGLSNLQTTLAVQSQIFLLPLILIGIWKLRSHQMVRTGLLMWLILFSLMTFIFPLAGGRGGFFHAGAAVQPIFWVTAPVGLEALIEIGIRRRNWKMERALRGFGSILIFLAIVFSAGLVWSRTIGESLDKPVWSKYWNDYQQVEKRLLALGAGMDDIVMVNNPPGYFNFNQRSAIMIPNGDEEVIHQTAKKYGAKYLVLDANVVKPLQPLYLNPRTGNGLTLLSSYDDYQIYRIEP